MCESDHLQQSIGYIIQPSNKKLMMSTEMEYLREKAKNMHIIDDELYFVIDEKNNTIDLTEKGREELSMGSKEGKEYFVLPDLGIEVSKLENDTILSDEEKVKRKDELYNRYSAAGSNLYQKKQGT